MQVNFAYITSICQDLSVNIMKHETLSKLKLSPLRYNAIFDKEGFDVLVEGNRISSSGGEIPKDKQQIANNSQFRNPNVRNGL